MMLIKRLPETIQPSSLITQLNSGALARDGQTVSDRHQRNVDPLVGVDVSVECADGAGILVLIFFRHDHLSIYFFVLS